MFDTFDLRSRLKCECGQVRNARPRTIAARDDAQPVLRHETKRDG
jgi:hypothetical protein